MRSVFCECLFQKGKIHCTLKQHRTTLKTVPFHLVTCSGTACFCSFICIAVIYLNPKLVLLVMKAVSVAFYIVSLLE